MYHIPVLFDEVMDALRLKKNGLYLDATAGGGGHSAGILERGGSVIALDRDADAINECKMRFEGNDRITLIKTNFKNAKEVFTERGISGLDGALIDLGVSSHQIDTPERGMSYRFNGPIDMRMDLNQKLTASDVVNNYGEEELTRILFSYGEERFSKRIAAEIIKHRPIETTAQLAEVVRKAYPKSIAAREPHPEAQTFQALRIEVNNELRGLENAIKDIFSMLNPGARLCVISFHSLESRPVKQLFNELSAGCVCDKSLPQCVCGHSAQGILKGKVKASEAEQKDNPRSRSATLRIIEKI